MGSDFKSNCEWRNNALPGGAERAILGQMTKAAAKGGTTHSLKVQVEGKEVSYKINCKGRTTHSLNAPSEHDWVRSKATTSGGKTHGLKTQIGGQTTEAIAIEEQRTC